MQLDDYWLLFQETGDPARYLIYCNAKNVAEKAKS